MSVCHCEPCRARKNQPDPVVIPDAELIDLQIKSVIVSKSASMIAFLPEFGFDNLSIPWITPAIGTTSTTFRTPHTGETDPNLVRAVARAPARMKDLLGGRFKQLRRSLYRQTRT
ncbi:MAG: hypothetical protein V4661_00580 [Pseudomonadota bacterium]